MISKRIANSRLDIPAIIVGLFCLWGAVSYLVLHGEWALAVVVDVGMTSLWFWGFVWTQRALSALR